MPERIGPYRVVRKLGHGGMARVLLARSVGASGFETYVAIKMLLPEHALDGDLERRLIEEAKQGARLRHRNLVAVRHLGWSDEGYFVVMEWVDGSDLAALIDGPLDESIALAIACELAEALAFVHGARDERGRPLGLVHRDVSPSNVLLSRAGEVKLSDLGIAKATKLKETTQASLRRGKYAYMSPEQVSGKTLDARSDQFAFGILLYELLLGRRPFDGSSIIETMDNIREAGAPDVSDMSDDIGAFLVRCMQHDPNGRFHDARKLLDALTNLRWKRAPVTSADLSEWVQARLEQPAPGREVPRTRPAQETS